VVDLISRRDWANVLLVSDSVRQHPLLLAVYQPDVNLAVTVLTDRSPPRDTGTLQMIPGIVQRKRVGVDHKIRHLIS
jgi:hypothetical protein